MYQDNVSIIVYYTVLYTIECCVASHKNNDKLISLYILN